MIGYVTVGADDLLKAQTFYSAILLHLGYTLDISHEGLSYCPSGLSTQANPAPDFYVKPPFDGRPASAGNGAMVAFRVPTQAMVQRLFGAALAAGGVSEGPPGFRAAYGTGFYVCYLRDPQGNKVALYSNNPAEPRRPD